MLMIIKVEDDVSVFFVELDVVVFVQANIID
jgi:hypothetical protein